MSYGMFKIGKYQQNTINMNIYEYVYTYTYWSDIMYLFVRKTLRF